MNLTRHPLWSVGFRPFFILACLAGLALPTWWVLIFTGGVPPPLTFALPAVQWHAHEMFYGFGWAVFGGFLLTASKNWLDVRGWHGGALVLLAAAWLFDRLAMSLGAGWPPALFWLAASLFQVAIVAMLLHTMLPQKVRGGASDNYFFWILLPLFLPAKLLILREAHFAEGWAMTLALFRVVVLIMLERTQVQYMRHAFRAEILRDPRLDMRIKWLALALACAPWLPAPVAGVAEAALALLLIVRFAGWKPWLAFSRLDVGIMYLGYLMIVAQLLVDAAGRFVELPWVGSVAAHLFTVGVLGTIMPAMIVRIAKGPHRPRSGVRAGRQAGAVDHDRRPGARVVAPQLHPGGYAMWLHLAAGCWLLAFLVLFWRYTPFLLAPRVDGKEH
ncbi:MAG: NnrS family protein [Rhodocyclaceae bacterium]|nr:NnrS family protein [Rhodocyclaceae bacterium]